MPLSTPSLSQSAQDFLHVSMNDFPEVDIQISNIESAEQKREKQTYMMALDRIDIEDDEQDTLFTKLSIDSVYSSYLTAQTHVCQYTQLLLLLKREEDAWAQRVTKASCLMPEYKPVGGAPSSRLGQIRFTKNAGCLKPISQCEHRVFGTLHQPTNPANAAHVSMATYSSIFDSDVLDVAMEDTDEQDHDAPAVTGQNALCNASSGRSQEISTIFYPTTKIPTSQILWGITVCLLRLRVLLAAGFKESF
ncbi:hypothetical protein EV424DRAFT_1535087 [Suillus variegatus]|nr:hypothetical protein EV424DRAFT_1535087 [Suillus variegatus]